MVLVLVRHPCLLLCRVILRGVDVGSEFVPGHACGTLDIEDAHHRHLSFADPGGDRLWRYADTAGEIGLRTGSLDGSVECVIHIEN